MPASRERKCRRRMYAQEFWALGVRGLYPCSLEVTLGTDLKNASEALTA